MRKPKKGQSLAEKYPELAAQWHPTKNGELTAFDFSSGSGKKVWWKCEKGDDHEWISTIIDRSNGNACPICSGRKTVLSNCLATTNSKLAAQWHPTKNAELTPFDFTNGSGKKIWWKCDKGEDHEWISTISHRTNGRDCPICSGRKVVTSNCLATTHPKLAAQWHPTKNGKLKPYDVTFGSSKKVWWKCPEGSDHEWNSTLNSRGKGCPICRNQKVVLSNCLATTHPKLAAQWHPTKNGKHTPYTITAGSHKKVWWKCPEGSDHEWESISANRLKGKNCPICSGRKATISNCLFSTHPKIAAQWHPTKNGVLTSYDVKAGSSSQLIWWKCDRGIDHEWKTTVVKRTFGRNCPFCNLTPQSKQELTITFELLKLFPDINPKGFKTRVEGKLWTIDIYVPSLNLGVEFDGSYWHKDKRALDKLKTKKLEGDGFNILRVREEPLKKISDSDIISKQPFNAKEITNNILTHIMNSFELEDILVKKIKAYISKKKLQNVKGLDEYIEMRLTEKADKD